MRIIYEDGEYREEREKLEKSQAQKNEDFIDISSMSEHFRKIFEEENDPDRPHRPAATLRPETATEEQPQQTPQPAPQQMPQQMPQQTPAAQPYTGQPVAYGYPQGYPQGYPVQYVQYPQGYAYPAPYGAVPQQGAYPHAQMYQPAPQTAPAAPQSAPQTPAANESGTRVIYQSPDFDKNENAPAAAQPKAVYQPQQPQYPVQPTAYPPVQMYQPQPVQMPVPQSVHGITQQDVQIPAPQVKPVVSKPLPDASFQVDDMEMSIFELNAMAHKYQAQTRAYKNPSQGSGSLEIEDCEEEIVHQPKNEPVLFDDEEEEIEIVTSEKKEKPGTKKKSKKKKRKELIRRTVLVISLIAIVVSVGFLVNEYRLSKMNAQLTEETNDLIIDVDSLISDYQQDHYEELTEPDGTVHELTDEEKQAIIDEEWAKVKKEYPKVNFPEGIQLEYARLYGENQDFVGFLRADGIDMKLPVVQTTNDDYYLQKDFYKRNTKYGTPFVTHLNTISREKYGLDTNTVIFGHHMNDGSVFGILDKYKTIEGFKAAPVITFNTLYNNYEWKVIAAFVTNAEASDDNGYVFKYYFTDLSTEARFSAYLNALSERSLYNTGVDVLPTDKILTLSTCSHEFDNARFVVVARMVRNGETSEVDVSRATVNSNPRYPQAYYDKKKQDNPYKDAYRWEVG